MPRPSKPKVVGSLPICSNFSGEINVNKEFHITLSVEEFETIRLIDYMGMNQEECAASMNVSRITVQTLYADARKKIARFLVEGSNLQIEGGNYILAEDVQKAKEEEKENHIRVCVPYCEGEVFQHFGRAEQLKIYEIEDHRILSSSVIQTEGRGHGTLVEFIKEIQADVVICGGIGVAARNALSEASIQLYGGAGGNADAQVESYLTGSLAYNPDYQCAHSREHGGTGCVRHHGE